MIYSDENFIFIIVIHIHNPQDKQLLQRDLLGPERGNNLQGPLLLTWFNFNPSMDK